MPYPGAIVWPGLLAVVAEPAPPRVSTPARAELALVRRAVGGDADALRALVHLLRPVVQTEVAWSLQRFAPRGRGRDPRQETADLVQEVFLALLENDARILSAWDPARGRGLGSFVQLVARHQVASVLRSHKRCPWTEDPTPLDDMALDPEPSPEARVVDVDEARRVMDELRGGLSTRSAMMFEGLYVQEREVDDVCQEFALTRDALYAWRSRLKRRAQDILQRLGRER